jgi:hypothetical protein
MKHKIYEEFANFYKFQLFIQQLFFLNVWFIELT